MELFVVIRTEFFQGDPVETQFCGVFDSVESAEGAIAEMASEDDPVWYDPTTRMQYTTKVTTLNEIYYEDV